MINTLNSMEELLLQQAKNNLFVKTSFPIKFSPELWKLISKQSPLSFQNQHFTLLKLLLNAGAHQKKVLEQFQRNHLTLYGWYLLASREKVDIQPYLFHPLLKNTHSLKNSTILPRQIHRSSKTEPSQIRKLFVQPYREGKTEKQSFLEEDNIHDLYLRTFTACRGQRYIPYDYDRHMKSGQERAHYNNFIRKNHKRANSNPNERKINPLNKYEEWRKSQEKASLMSFRTVLSDLELNNQKGLQGLLKRKGAQKLVFINHQRKPVNYFIKGTSKKIA